MRSGFRAGTPPTGSFDEVGRWDLDDLGGLRSMRLALRDLLPDDAPSGAGPQQSPLDRLLLVANELASNALRHGGGRAHVVLGRGDTGWLLVVTDPAVSHDPSPAVDRTPGEGGYGLYLVQALGLETGWYTGDGHKHVWTHVSATTG